MDPYDEEICVFCSLPASYCNCKLYGIPWSPSMPSVQVPLFDDLGHETAADLDETTRCMLPGNSFLDAPFEYKDFEIDNALAWLAPCVTDTDVTGPDISISPHPADSSTSPFGYDTGPVTSDWDTSPLSMDPVLLVSHLEDVTVGPAFGVLYDDYPPRVNGGVQRGTAITEFAISHGMTVLLPASTTMSPHRPPTPHPCSELVEERIWFSDMARSLQSQHILPEVAKGNSLIRSREDEENDYGTIDDDVAASDAGDLADGSTQDVCADATPECNVPDSDRKPLEEWEEIGRHSSLTPVSEGHESWNSSNVSDSDFPKSSQPTSPSCSLANQDSQCATADVPNGNEDSPSKKLPSALIQATLDRYMPAKRPCSTIDHSPPSKKIKLCRPLPGKPADIRATFKTKYQAKEPASLRRARSLRSEASLCSDTFKDSLIFPPSQRTPIPQARLEKTSSVSGFPPTQPSTPIPDSVEYERSKADPLSRTIPIHRHSSQAGVETGISPVSVIAPPPYPIPTIIRGEEDQAIDRLKCLLLRERAERERDGLNVHDEKRAKTLRLNSSLPQHDSISTSSSSEDSYQWEEESTFSAADSSASQDTVSVSVKALSAEDRRISRKTWSESLGLPNKLRDGIISWMLEIQPGLPEPGYTTQLYDQLKNSPHTRFHALHMFLRYFLRPRKAEDWRRAYKRSQMIGSRLDWADDCWNLALACIILSHKLHRDVLPPLEPVYTCEFLGLIAPWWGTYTYHIESSQRDIFQTLDFTLGSCTPQDVLDELWNALPTLRKTVDHIRRGWEVVQRETWNKLFEAITEPDVMQYPVTLLTAAALVDSLVVALALQFKTESEGTGCQCNSTQKAQVPESASNSIEPTSWQIYTFEAMQLVDGVILDVKDVLQLSKMELEECRQWLGYVGED